MEDPRTEKPLYLAEEAPLDNSDASSSAKSDLLSSQHVDPALEKKMHLVNDVRLLAERADRMLKLNWTGD